MTDYSTLVAPKTVEGSIRNWVNRADIPATAILTEAEAMIYERLRTREMMIDIEFIFDIGTSSEPLPSALLDPIQFKPFTHGAKLPFVHEQAFPNIRDENGALYEGDPSCWTIIGIEAFVDVSCATEFGGRLMFYAQPEPLGSGNPTNFLTQRYPTLLRNACLSRAYEHMKDSTRAMEYLKLTMVSLQQAASTNDMFRRSQYMPAFEG